MKFLFSFLLLFAGWCASTSAQDQPLRTDTIVEVDGQFFMPGMEGIKEKSIVVDPFITRQKPSQVNLLKKKLETCTALFFDHPLLTDFHGLKATFTTEIYPMDGFNELVRWLPSRIELGIRTTQAKDSLPAWEPTPEAWVTLHFNNPRKLVGNPIINDIYLAPIEMEPVNSWNVYDRISVPNRVAAVHNKTTGFYEPVSREDFILSLINYFQTSIDKGEKQANSQRKSPDTPEEGIKMNIEFQKFEASLKEIRKYDPYLADKLMQAYIESGNPMLEKPSDESGSVVDKMIVLNTWKEAVRKLKAEMNAMSPLERRTQAWWSNTEDTNVSGLTPAGDSGSRPLIRLNKNLIDKTKPSSAIQLIVAEWSMLPDEEFLDNTGYNLAYTLLYNLSHDEELWQQVRNLLDN